MRNTYVLNSIAILNVCAATSVIALLIHDCVMVYKETHRINNVIYTEVSKLKSRTPIAMYIDAPKIQDPWEAVLNVIDTLLFLWFMSVSYIITYILQVVRHPPFVLFRNKNLFFDKINFL